MLATQIPITTGPAGGTLVTEVRNDNGTLLGFIRVVECDWTPVLGGTTIYLSQQCYSVEKLEDCKFGIKACSTLADAYQFLGVSMIELDNSDMGPYPFSEKIPHKYWEERKLRQKQAKLINQY